MPSYHVFNSRKSRKRWNVRWTSKTTWSKKSFWKTSINQSSLDPSNSSTSSDKEATCGTTLPGYGAKSTCAIYLSNDTNHDSHDSYSISLHQHSHRRGHLPHMCDFISNNHHHLTDHASRTNVFRIILDHILKHDAFSFLNKLTSPTYNTWNIHRRPLIHFHWRSSWAIDLTISLDHNRKLITTLYRKPTDCQWYLHFSSHHPEETKMGIIYS